MPSTYDSRELLSKDTNVLPSPSGGVREAESAGLSPQDTWTSVATLCQGWSHLRMFAQEYQMGKSQPVWMDCTAVSSEDTRGQEALTEKLRLDF